MRGHRGGVEAGEQKEVIYEPFLKENCVHPTTDAHRRYLVLHQLSSACRCFLLKTTIGEMI